MCRALIPLLILSALWSLLPLSGQTQVRISEPRLELHENEVHIYYDILQGQPEEKYEINLDIRDEAGHPLPANSLEGDMGLVESPGRDKQIVWDLEADNIYMNAHILVKISARVIAPPPPAAVEEEVMADESDTKECPEDAAEGSEDPSGRDAGKIVGETDPAKVTGEATAAGSYNRTALMLQSLAIPGLGLSRVTGKPHWLRAVAGYGCIGGAIAMNQASRKSFDSLEDQDTRSEAEEVFHQSVRQDKVSEVLAFTAIGIWMADAVWTWFGTSGLESAGLSVSGMVDPLLNTPVVQLKICF